MSSQSRSKQEGMRQTWTEGYEQYLATLPKPKHTHQYVIPVEWEAVYRDTNYRDRVAEAAGKTGVIVPFTNFSVTKLRCACGEEIVR